VEKQARRIVVNSKKKYQKDDWMRGKQINHYSELVRAELLEDLPSLAPHLTEQPDGSLFLELVSPSGSKFWLSTESDELTVGFEAHHVHFSTPWDPDPAADARDAAEYVLKLMSGQYCIAVWSRDDKFIQSETVPKGVNPADVPRSWLGRCWLKGCSVEVRCW
jgi:hypothetical protein